MCACHTTSYERKVLLVSYGTSRLSFCNAIRLVKNRIRTETIPPARVNTCARKDQQQDIHDSSSDTDSEGGDTDEAEDSSMKVRKARRFLDSICEAMSQKRGGGDVFAAALLDHDDRLEIVISKNEKLGERDRALMRNIQTWLQSTARVGKRPKYISDKLAEALLRHGEPRLKEWLKNLRGIQDYSIVPYTKKPWIEKAADSLTEIQVLGQDIDRLDMGRRKQLVLACHVLRAHSDFEKSLSPQPQTYKQRHWMKEACKSIKFIGRFASWFVLVPQTLKATLTHACKVLNVWWILQCSSVRLAQSRYARTIVCPPSPPATQHYQS